MPRHDKKDARRPRKGARPGTPPVAPDLGTDRWDDNAYGAADKSDALFTPGEIGQPDQALGPDASNPQAAQSGLGALGQNEQGERQNDQIEELEALSEEEARKDLEDRA